MARIDWVVAKLNNWALWAERQKAGGLGFAPSSVLLAAAASRDQERVVRLPVDEIAAGVTDQAVSSLKPVHPHLHTTLVLIYLKGVGVNEAARDQFCEPSTIYRRLERCDVLLREWFNARAERQAEAKKSFTP